jgi:hypothetical protein
LTGRLGTCSPRLMYNGHRSRGHGRKQSLEKTFDLSVKGIIQVSYGKATINSTRPVTSGFTCLTSQYPVPARFLELNGAFIPPS